MAATVDDQDPALQLVQVDAAANDQVPATQEAQVKTEVAPLDVDHVPELQEVHEVALTNDHVPELQV